MPSQAGKRFLITGANSGVGFFAALALAQRGATVVLACRDRSRGEAALARLRAEAAGAESAASRAELTLVDMASLASIREAAERELARGLPLDGLVNNAGVFAPPRRGVTADGFELQFGTNVLGHFALTCHLLPALERAAAARVVTLASISHKRGSLHWDDLQFERSYSPMQAYEQSKLADLMFAFELERRLRAAGRRTISLAVHPGVAESNLFKVGKSTGLAAVAEGAIRRTVAIFLNSSRQGALPTVFALTAPGAKPGGYYGPQGFREMRGGDVGEAIVAPAAQDVSAQRRLWETCAELTGVSLPA